MPELPEVETIAANLRLGKPGQPALPGMRILRAHLLWQRTLVTPSAPEFYASLPGQQIQEIGRRGKFLVLRLSRDTLLFHLRMSGDLWVEAVSDPFSQHHRLALDLEEGFRLAFNDPRKFGRAWLVSDPNAVLGELGPEPLDPALTAESFHHRLNAHRRRIKPLLLDQAFLAGLGNIYTDEALHLAKLHPHHLSHTLKEDQSARLLHSIRAVLQEGIRRNGASIDWVYRGGDFQNYFKVYRRTGNPCSVCGTPIQRIMTGQRSTHFCPQCQPAAYKNMED